MCTPDNLLEHKKAEEILQIGDGDTIDAETDTKNRNITDIIIINQNNEQNSNDDNLKSESNSANTEKPQTDDIISIADRFCDIEDSDVSEIDIKTEHKLDHKLDKYTARAEKLEKQIEKAEAKIPKKRVKRSKLVHDEQTGKEKRQISFADEKIEKADAKWNQGQSRTLSANTRRYVTGHASAIVHGKVAEAENMRGNTGLKAAHSGEKAVVKTYQTAKRVHRYVKNAPYRKLQHLKLKEAENKGKLAYQQLLKDKPELRKNSVSRMIQKRRIKNEYAKAFQAAQSGGTVEALGKIGAAIGVGAAAVSGDGKALAKMGSKVAFKKAAAVLFKAAAPFLFKLGLGALIIGAVLLLFTMCVSLIGTSTGYLLDGISYRADMDDITTHSVYMTRLEVDLKEKIIESADDVEGLHEFRFVLNSPSGDINIIFERILLEAGVGHPYFTPPVYAPPNFDPLVLLPFLSDITHNPFEIMAYLTAVYGDFDGYDINAILREIFEAAFTLEIVEGYEVRSMMVEAWYYELQDLGEWQDLGGWQDFGWFDPDFGWIPNWQWVSDWQWISDWQGVRAPPYEETMYYNWYYREVILSINSTISEVLQVRMDDDQREHHDILMESLGLRQFMGSPFAENWLGNMTSPFGYRFHPITRERQMHTGIDIAKPEGTPILSGAPGIVTFAGKMGSYGKTVIIEHHDAERGVGVRILYAHLADIGVVVDDEVRIGDIIGTVGQTGTATGLHLHMEISANERGGDWRRINPKFFTQPYQS